MRQPAKEPAYPRISSFHTERQGEATLTVSAVNILTLQSPCKAMIGTWLPTEVYLYVPAVAPCKASAAVSITGGSGTKDLLWDKSRKIDTTAVTSHKGPQSRTI